MCFIEHTLLKVYATYPRTTTLHNHIKKIYNKIVNLHV